MDQWSIKKIWGMQPTAPLSEIHKGISMVKPLNRISLKETQLFSLIQLFPNLLLPQKSPFPRITSAKIPSGKMLTSHPERCLGKCWVR